MLGDPPSPRQRGYKGSYGDAVNRITRRARDPSSTVLFNIAAHLPRGSRHPENLDLATSINPALRRDQLRDLLRERVTDVDGPMPRVRTMLMRPATCPPLLLFPRG